MMRYLGVLLVLTSVFLACSTNENQTKEDFIDVKSLEGMKADLKHFEDSLKLKEKGFNQQIGVMYAEKCLAIAAKYPKASEAPKCMDKAHIIFATIGLNQRAVFVAEELVKKYPNYKNKLMVLESLASSYDIFIVPRQKDKVKMYYDMMLTEFPDMPIEQKELIEKRLKYIDLSFEEYIAQTN